MIFFSVDLQKRAADMFGMEATLYVPTATMSNLIAGEIAEWYPPGGGTCLQLSLGKSF